VLNDDNITVATTAMREQRFTQRDGFVGFRKLIFNDKNSSPIFGIINIDRCPRISRGRAQDNTDDK
jgi:hypothetical protein